MMGLYDTIYNVVPSPYTGIVYPELQTKDTGSSMVSYNFYQLVDQEKKDFVVRGYTSDDFAERFLNNAFFEVYYKVKDGRLTPDVEKVVAYSGFPQIKFLDLQKYDMLVYIDDKVDRVLVHADYRDVLFILSMLGRIKILKDTRNEFCFKWKGKKITLKKVPDLPIKCNVCGNVKKFTVREDLFSYAVFNCCEHDYIKGNALYLKSDVFWGWRFFDSFSVIFFLAEVYGVTVKNTFEMGGIEFTFVELPGYSKDYPVIVRIEDGKYENIESVFKNNRNPRS